MQVFILVDFWRLLYQSFSDTLWQLYLWARLTKIQYFMSSFIARIEKLFSREITDLICIMHKGWNQLAFFESFHSLVFERQPRVIHLISQCVFWQKRKNADRNNFENIHRKTHCIFHTFLQLKMDISFSHTHSLHMEDAESGIEVRHTMEVVFFSFQHINRIMCIVPLEYFPPFSAQIRLKWMAFLIKTI